MEKIMNKQAWDACVAALKPTKKQLEYGLKLHEESLVVDAYGLGIYARPSRAGAGRIMKVFEQKLKEGASAAELMDFSEEMGQVINIEDTTAWNNYLQAWRSAGVTCIFQNAGEENQDPLRVIRRLARHTLITDFRKELVFKAASPVDIEAARKSGRRCLYLTANAVPLVQRWESAEGELDLIRIFFQMGIRMMHLTYNRRNMLGDGCGELNDAGLSDFGRAAVAEMNRAGVIVDIAHSGRDTGREAAEVSSKPVVASHSGCDAVNRHYRCKPDGVIRAVVDTGGYIGICCYGLFLGGDGGINAFLDHVDYAARKFGTESVAIGTDRSCIAGMDKGEAGFPVFDFPARRPGWQSLWPDAGVTSRQLKTCERNHAQLEWTNWPLFTVGLVKRGYKDRDIRRIIGENVLRVAGANLEGLPYAC